MKKPDSQNTKEQARRPKTKPAYRQYILPVAFIIFYWVFSALAFPALQYTSIKYLLPTLFFLSLLWETIGKKYVTIDKAAEKTIYAYLLLFLALMANQSILIETWSRGTAGYFSIGGLLPWSDAVGYYKGSMDLIHFGELGHWNARRPLAAMAFSSIMWLNGYNLMGVYMSFALMAGLSIWFVSCQLMRSHGLSAGLFVVLGASIFFGKYNGLFMTELPGFVAGGFALGFLWGGMHYQRQRDFLWGLFLLMLALGIRAGAFVVVPLLVVYTGFLFKGAKVIRLKPMALALAVIIAGYALTPIGLELLGPDKGGKAMGNLSYQLYGLASGGKGWEYVTHEHPEVKDQNLTDAERSDIIYNLAMDKIKNNKAQFVKTIADHWADVFRHPMNFFFTNGTGLNDSLFIILWLLSFLSLLFMRGPGDDKAAGFVLVFLTGIIISSPFLRLVPGWEMNQHMARVYAATATFNYLMVALGLGMLVKRVQRKDFKPSWKLQKHNETPKHKPSPLHQAAWALSGLLVFLFVILPFLLSWGAAFDSNNKNTYQDPACGQHQTLIVPNAGGSQIIVSADGKNYHMPEVSYSAYMQNNPGIADGPPQFRALKPGHILALRYNLLQNKNHSYIIFPAGTKFRKDGYSIICARIVGEINNFKLYYSQSLRTITEKELETIINIQ